MDRISGPSYIRYSAGYRIQYRALPDIRTTELPLPVSGEVFGEISGIRPDIRADIQYAAGCPVYGQVSGIRPDNWPGIRYKAGY